MRRTSATLIFLAAASWANAAETAGGKSMEKEAITVEEVLANPLDDDAYANTQRCLLTIRYRRIEIVAERALIFYGRGDTAWLNVLPYQCRGLRPDMILSIEQSNFRVCATDRFQGVPRGSVQLGTAVCSLGEFERLTHEQVAARRDALLAEQRNRTVARTLRSTRSIESGGKRDASD